MGELVELYAADTDWATGLAGRHAAGTDAAAVVDAAFSRYAREASDFAGGRARESHARPCQECGARLGRAAGRS